MLHHQDWETVIWKKKPSDHENQKSTKAIRTTSAVVSTTANKPAWKIEQQVDAEHGKPIRLVAREDAQKIIAARVAKKMTQKDLACRLNMQLKDIQDIESCKAVENKAVLSKIRRVLDITR